MADTATPTRPTQPDQPADVSALEELVEPDTNVTVIQALCRVMKDVTVLRKDRTQSAGGSSFKFRGIDDVMNAVGPAFRKHGVICLPNVLSVDVEHATTAKGSAMTVTRVQVEYLFYGPAGDHITCRTPGEAFDSGDKSTAKAMSVAYRTALLQALTLPTDEPDPDETVEELAPRQADRHRAGQTQAQRREDPWNTPPLRAAGKGFLSQALACGDVEALLTIGRAARTDEQSHGPQFVHPGDVGPEVVAIFNMLGPVNLTDFLVWVKKHLEVEGISVNEHIAAEQAHRPTTEERQ